MKTRIYKLILFAGIVLIGFSARSQGLTMYHMNLMGQKHQYNPALTGDWKFYVGVPGASSVGLGMEFIGFKIGSLVENINEFRNSISDYNYINNEIQSNIFSLGMKIGKGYLTLDASLKNSFHLSLSEDLILFATSGNGQFIGENAMFTGTTFSETLYMEYALGYSRTLFKRLTIGAKVKYLNGILNASMMDWDAGVYTAPTSYEMDVWSRGTVNISGPMDIAVDENNNIDFDNTEVITDPDRLLQEYVLKNSNKGFAVDFGASYKVLDNLIISASVIDMINSLSWNQNIYTIAQDGEFHFDGFDFDPLAENNDEFYQPILDTLESSFALSSSQNSYISKISPKYYLGANFRLFKGLHFGGLISGQSFDNKSLLTYTLSANAHLGRMLVASVSGSKTGGGGISYGVGLAVKILPVQIYIIGENITGFYYDPNYIDGQFPIVWPGDISHVHLRFGVNVVFGAITNDSGNKE